jgi:7-cyano-7-deazaguanine synthase
MSDAKAVCLLSGGLDSATTLAMARAQGFALYAMSFRYGQRHVHELACATKLGAWAQVAKHVVVEIDLRVFGGSALTDESLAVPKDRSVDVTAQGIPITYVPARNTIFLSFALAWAETLEASDIFIGVNAMDYSGYPDCRPEYIQAYQRMANLATKAAAEGRHMAIHTPLIQMTKAQIIRAGVDLGVDYAMTSTCYDPSAHGEACGTCDACGLRLKGFAEAGMEDPAAYLAKG